MKKAKLPLPVLILISATLFLFSSTFGEWIGRPSTALRTPARETVEQQQTAIVYVRVMSWLSQLISHPAAHSEVESEAAYPADPAPAPTRDMAAHRVQLCALSKPSHASRSLCKSSQWQLTIHTSPPSLARLFNGQRTSDN
jgi:hypothetical protein